MYKYKNMDLGDLFDECSNDKKYTEPKNMIHVSVEKMMTEIEAEFTGISTSLTERKKEKKDLEDKIVATENNLKNIKNPKNFASMPYAKREIMSKKLHNSREQLRKEIRICKVRLDEIKIEEGDQTPVENPNEKSDVPNIEHKIDKWNANPYSDFL
jgi:predicted  nucleic acid-binding Zn-ribbon protein